MDRRLDSHRLVAYHPAIADHLATRRPRSAIATIAYGADPVTSAPEAPVRALGLEPGRYLISIARIEPDNNILPIVEAFCSRKRDMKLVVLARFPTKSPITSPSAGGEWLGGSAGRHLTTRKR